MFCQTMQNAVQVMTMRLRPNQMNVQQVVRFATQKDALITWNNGEGLKLKKITIAKIYSQKGE